MTTTPPNNLPSSAAGEGPIEITLTQDENADPNAHLDLVIGTALPALKASTAVPSQLFHHIPRGMKVLHSPSDPNFPPELRDVDSEMWTNANFLKNNFLRPNSGRSRNKKGSKTHRTCPLCILLLAKDVDDRMVLYNWWLQLDDRQQESIVEVCKRVFVRCTKSCELSVAYDPDRPRVTLITDSQQL